MKPIIQRLLLLVLSLGLPTLASAHSYDLNHKQVITLENIVADLMTVQAVFVGELHDRPAHHQAQLQVIQELRRAGAEVSIGLEMFRQDGQPALDRWLQGKTSEADFEEIFDEHWSMWEMYKDIFSYARQEKIPLVGLNIPRELVNQVARKGFASLSDQQRAKLPLAACNVSPKYRDFIRRALNGHGDNGTEFEHFCEAQMLWDASMARNLEEYLQQHPQRTVVVLAGNGHSWKHGIPEQLQRRGSYDTRVLLPEIPGYIDLQTIDGADADYLLQGVEEPPLH